MSNAKPHHNTHKELFYKVLFEHVLKEYGVHLTIENISKILGVNRSDTAKYISISGAESCPMPSGRTYKYNAFDLPLIIEKYQAEKLKELSKCI